MATTAQDSFGTRQSLDVSGRSYTIYSLAALESRLGNKVARLPFALKVLLENLLRHEDGDSVTADDIEALAARADGGDDREIAFRPARVLMQDFTGVPAVVDLAAMRDAMAELGGDPARINPLSPAELVIDHSVQVDVYGKADALDLNTRIEFERNRERYEFLKWGQQAFDNFRVVPPSTGIVHQVNLEHLARVVFGAERDGGLLAYPDTLVGTDSHTTMINGIGVLGWGVGGIEAEAAMLGQPVSMLIPEVVGFRLTGELPEGATATDLVLTVTQMLRRHGVVGKFVEFFGDGLQHLPLADRATIANMAPEYGATCGIFPIDGETLRYLRLTGRDAGAIELVEHYARAQGLFHEEGQPQASYSASLELDLAEVVPSLAGPKRPQDRILLSNAKQTFLDQLPEQTRGRMPTGDSLARLEGEGGGTAVGNREVEQEGSRPVTYNGETFDLKDGAVVIAAITSCTNTSNPAVMLGAGLLARNAVAKGLKAKPWVKTSLAPGSQVVTEYLNKAGVMDDLESLGFYLVGYGCTTCIGNSGPLPDEIGQAVRDGNLVVCSVLSGNRNFEGRVHQDVRMNYLASPPLVVAYALAGRMDLDLYSEPLGADRDGKPVYLKDIWPTSAEIQQCVGDSVTAQMFSHTYQSVFAGDRNWNAISAAGGDRYDWSDDSTYIKNPPYFEAMGNEPPPLENIESARCIALLGDSITTDHISPAGAIAPDTPAGKYLLERGVQREDFNSYGSRRGNHEVMMRGTFANVRLRNKLAPGTEGGWTRHMPDGEQMYIFDAAMRYKEEDVPLVVLAGREYGTGSSRDWAAKGTLLLGIRAVIAESYERIHRSNLVGMGVLPLQFIDGQNAESLGLDGRELFTIEGLTDAGAKRAKVTARTDGGDETCFEADIRLDTPMERDYFRHGGILQYVLRRMASGEA